MRKAYLVALPPGAGKTRTVLLHILEQSSGNLKTLCRNLLVVGPNRRVEHVWLREVALLLCPGDHSKQSAIREMRAANLRRDLKKQDCSIRFISFRDLGDAHYVEPAAYIVLDEWHRYSLRNAALLTALKQGPLGNHTYFVSATPLNPVLEGAAEDALIEDPEEDVSTIRKCSDKALRTISELTGIDFPSEEKVFAKAIQQMGVEWVSHDTGWCAPKFGQPWAKPFPEPGELAVIDASTHSASMRWKSEEAAWAIGLVKTQNIKSKNQFLLGSPVSNKNLVFDYCYANPHVVPNPKGLLATTWLVQHHPRVPRLLDLLQQIAVLHRDKTSKPFVCTGKKVLIFCIHQGVARGLQLALESVIAAESKAIFCDVHEDLKDEHQSGFMQAHQVPYILIATDKLSESIDLHGDCQTVVHYELPWSPLRLLQRVGRLTRMHRDLAFRDTEVYHVMIPGSVEEERVNRLIRRTELLHDEGAWPLELYGADKNDWMPIAKALIGSGPSMHLNEVLAS